MTIKYFWVCDGKSSTGEGNLARLYIKKIIGKKIIITCETFFENKIFQKILNYKYISPFFGIFVCWYFYYQKKNISYVNYLPLWNFFIFLLLPPGTNIGPVTGGALFSKNNQYIVRKYAFPILYKISEKILNYRFAKILFATSLLKKHLSKKTITKSEFNFVLHYLKLKKTKKKKIDFLIYYRKHINKLNLFNYSFVEKINKKNLKIYIVGDKLDMPNIKNIGYISNNRLKNLLAKTRYTLSSNENIYSLFNIECINNNVKIFAHSKDIPKDNFFRKKFISLKRMSLNKNF